METESTYKITAKEAKVYVPGAYKLVRSEFPSFKKDETVKGFGEQVRVDTGKNIFAINVAEGQYLRPQDLVQVDANGDVITTFTNKGYERLSQASTTKVKDFPSPVLMYSSDGTLTYISEHPKPIFTITDNKLVRTGETFNDKTIEATVKKMNIGGKVRHLLELEPNKYLMHINVKPVPKMQAFMNLEGDTKVPEKAKDFIEKGNALSFTKNEQPGWVSVSPFMGAALAAGIAYKYGKQNCWYCLASWAVIGAALGYGVSAVLKPKPTTI